MSKPYPNATRVALVKAVHPEPGDRPLSLPGGIATSLILGTGKDAVQLDPEQSRIAINHFLVLRKAAARWRSYLASGSRLMIVDEPFIEAVNLYLEERDIVTGLRVFLDDLRPAPEGWTWAKTPAEAIALLESGEVEVIASTTTSDTTARSNSRATRSRSGSRRPGAARVHAPGDARPLGQPSRA